MDRSISEERREACGGGSPSYAERLRHRVDGLWPEPWKVAAVAMALLVACGGQTRHDPPSHAAAAGGGAGGAGGAGAAGGAVSGRGSGGAGVIEPADAGPIYSREPPSSCESWRCPSPLDAGVPCCLTGTGPCGYDLGAGCIAWSRPPPAPPVFDACVPAACPSTDAGAGCCIAPEGPCGVNEGNGCEPPSCRAGQPVCLEAGGCDCYCGGCDCEWQACGEDPHCLTIVACFKETKCTGIGCYQPGTCQGVIDAAGGPFAPSLALAQALSDCSFTKCDCSF